MDVGERGGAQREDVVGESADVEVIAHDRSGTRLDQYLGDWPGCGAHNGERAPGAGVDIRMQHQREARGQLDHRLFDREVERGRVDRVEDGRGRAPKPVRHFRHKRSLELVRYLREPRKIVGESRLGFHESNTTVAR